MRQRTKAREIAIQFLYQIDLRGQEIISSLEEFIEENGQGEISKKYAKELIQGCIEKWNELNNVISQRSQNWPLDRMPAVDRNILRVAAYELMYCKETPDVVVINEAIELGKRFSTEQSGAFINAILDKVAKSLKESSH